MSHTEPQMPFDELFTSRPRSGYDWTMNDEHLRTS